MNVGGLNDNGVIAHALLPAKMDSLYFYAFEQRFATSVQSVYTFLLMAEDGEARTDRRSERKPALQCVESKRLLQKLL